MITDILNFTSERVASVIDGVLYYRANSGHPSARGRVGMVYRDLTDPKHPSLELHSYGTERIIHMMASVTTTVGGTDVGRTAGTALPKKGRFNGFIRPRKMRAIDYFEAEYNVHLFDGKLVAHSNTRYSKADEFGPTEPRGPRLVEVPEIQGDNRFVKIEYINGYDATLLKTTDVIWQIGPRLFTKDLESNLSWLNDVRIDQIVGPGGAIL